MSLPKVSLWAQADRLADRAERNELALNLRWFHVEIPPEPNSHEFFVHVAFPKAQISERLLENPAVRHFLLTFEEQDPFAVPDWNVSSWGLDGIGFMFFAQLCLSDGPRTLRLLGGLDLFEFQVLSECSQTLRCQMSFYHEDWPDLLPCIASIGIQARKCISDS